MLRNQVIITHSILILTMSDHQAAFDLICCQSILTLVFHDCSFYIDGDLSGQESCFKSCQNKGNECQVMNSVTCL